MKEFLRETLFQVRHLKGPETDCPFVHIAYCVDSTERDPPESRPNKKKISSPTISAIDEKKIEVKMDQRLNPFADPIVDDRVAREYIRNTNKQS